MTTISARSGHRRATIMFAVLAFAAIVVVALLVSSVITGGGAANNIQAPADSSEPAQQYDPFEDEFNTELRGVEHPDPHRTPESPKDAPR